MKNLNKTIKVLVLITFLMIPLPTGTITFVVGLSYLTGIISILVEIFNLNFNLEVYKSILIIFLISCGFILLFKSAKRKILSGIFAFYLSLSLLVKKYYFNDYTFLLFTSLFILSSILLIYIVFKIKNEKIQ